MRQHLRKALRKRWWGLLLILPLLLLVVWKLRPREKAVVLTALPEHQVVWDKQHVIFQFSAPEQPVQVQVTLSTPAGPLVETLKLEGSADLKIPYVRAGLLPYLIEAGGKRFKGQTSRAAGNPITPLSLNVGARAARVVGDRPPAVVVHPLDRDLNVADVPVQIQTEKPDGQRWKTTLKVKHLLAWGYLPESTGGRTGKMQVSAVALQARTESAVVDLQPGFTRAGTLTAPVNRVTLGTQTVWRLQGLGLMDQEGNPILDGTAVHVRGSGEGWRFFSTQPSVMGEMPLNLLPTLKPGVYRFQITTDHLKSKMIQLEAAQIKVLGNITLSEQKVLRVGPLLTPLGALLDDGTPVLIEMVSSSGSVLQEIRTVLQNGFLRMELPLMPQGTMLLRVSVAGLEKSFEVQESLPESRVEAVP